MMLAGWWHLAQTPTGPHAHQLDPVAMQTEADRRVAEDPELTREYAEAEVLGDEAERIRTELGFPPRGRWMSRPPWDSAISQGEPHPNYLATATVHRVGAE